jgi:hypothetical protein
LPRERLIEFAKRRHGRLLLLRTENGSAHWTSQSLSIGLDALARGVPVSSCVQSCLNAATSEHYIARSFLPMM